ncbi:MAG: hypothetical protein BWX92_03697 [Deltaproteobacteria bacterium ADurb.Bin135]|nr:MAG: hypothetical protein BWX92_03697 [Deltaproteobacteria bacterium ADurb.Bin135]
MNSEKTKKQIIKFLKGKEKKYVDTFCFYQWIDRCYFQKWWNLALAIEPYITTNSLPEEYIKRLKFLLAECRIKNSETSNKIINEETSLNMSLNIINNHLKENHWTREFIIGEIAKIIMKWNPIIHVNNYKGWVLRVASGRTGLTIESWMYKSLSFYVGVSASGRKAKDTLLSILEKNNEFIVNSTGHSFSIKGGNKNPDSIWIESQILYDKNTPPLELIERLASEYYSTIVSFRQACVKKSNTMG